MHRTILFSAVLSISLCVHAADDAPVWLRQAAAASVPKYDSKVAAVVLYDESRVNVEEGGKVTTVNTRAVRILNKDGRGEAAAREIYTTGTGKVKDMRAWLIRPTGALKKYGKERVLDLALVNNDVYNEVRVRAISAADDAEPGAVFGYEAVTEDRALFTQFEWHFQRQLPAVVSRYVLNVPAGWRAESILYNHAKVEPSTQGTTYTWELRNLGTIDEEPSSPALSTLAPRLAVSLVPAPGARTGLGQVFQNWADVARWLGELADPQAGVNNDLTEKAQSLTRNAATDYERIEAVGRYVQGVKYVSIQTGVGRGGGYRPHAATEIFAKSYGDCKDKATLMRAMLKVVGVESYPVAIYSGDRTRVREEWASPQQFNHCILAARLKDAVKAPAIGNHPKLGRLLFFDPTDEDTPVGSLPEHEENSLALVMSRDTGDLIRMPVSAPESNFLERRLELALAEDGSISGKVHESAHGHAGVEYRGKYRRLSRPDYQKSIERWIASSGSGASVSKVNAAEDTRDSFDLEVEFQTPRYAQSMQGRLLVLRPAVLPVHSTVWLSEAARKYPVVLNAESFQESMKLKLPGGFAVDEYPPAFQFETPFGSFSQTCEVKQGYVEYKRSLVVKASVVPVDQYKEVRNVFGRVYGSERMPVVLARK